MPNISTSRSWRVEYNNFAAVTHASKSSRVGGQGRASGNGYVSETLLVFDLSTFAGQTVQSVALTGTLSGWDGLRTNDTNIIVRSQNKKRRGYWNDSELPRYDDFNAVVGPWDTSLSGVLLPRAGSGTVVIPTAPGLVDEVQNLIDGVPDFWATGVDRTWFDGIVLTATMEFYSYYSSFSSWVLNINATAPATNTDYHYRTRRG
jgi:hypothetical protein